MIVVDTNIICYFFLTGEHNQEVELLLQKDPNWIAPVLWRSEFRNVLATYMQNAIIDLEDAQQLMAEVLAFMHGREFTVPSSQVLGIAQAIGLSAYDCEFIALAQETGSLLITSDQKIVAAQGDFARLLGDFV